MKLLDANVVIYSEGREHPYRGPCKIVMEQVNACPGEYAIDVESLQEILHVYSKRGESEKGMAIAQRLLNLFSEIIPITTAEIVTAIRLFRETPGLSGRDAIHAAVVMEHGLEGIVSADRDFDRIPGLRRYDPMELAAGQGAAG